jgi:hypothetical protein
VFSLQIHEYDQKEPVEGIIIDPVPEGCYPNSLGRGSPRFFPFTRSRIADFEGGGNWESRRTSST